MTMKRLAVLLALAACSGAPGPQPRPTLAAAPVAPTTACYQGTSSGAGQRVRTLVRRTMDPDAHQIVEDVVHGDAGAVTAFHVVMAVTDATFTIRETAGGVTGTGTLTGPAWQWTSWSSTSQRTADGLEIESRHELTPTGRTAHKQVRKAGAVVATLVDELTTFDCAEWDTSKAALAVPALDDALCDRACRRFATLRYEAAAAAEIAALPADQRDEAKRRRAAGLTAKLDAGAPACIAQCRAANNPAQTTCLARAASLDQLAACDAK